ncbi:MAG: hypothetical protein ACLQVF_08330 [Isosphaeraceae bacterium]
MTIDGPGANELSVSGNDSGRVFEIAVGQAAISGLTITCSTFTDNEALGRTTNRGALSTGENETFAAPSLAIGNCTFTGNEAVGASGANNSAALFGG